MKNMTDYDGYIASAVVAGVSFFLLFLGLAAALLIALVKFIKWAWFL